jgi:hypothetical protein
VFSVLWSDPMLYNEKTTIIDSSVQFSSVQFSSVGSQNSSSGVSSRKKMTMCQICELL